MNVTISFQKVCDKAINFYKEALGAEVKEIAYFRDAPEDSGMDPSLPPDFVMHSEVSIYGTTVIMTDGGSAPITGDYFSLMLAFDTAEEVTAVYNKLADGGNMIAPLATQFWATLCGDVQDRFGIHWHICTNN
ncbi:MAG: VOC family protein [Defluviitaleaceae bacterium]|nr:VOC family protein [Defluviitaleaceae bacterium]